MEEINDLARTPLAPEELRELWAKHNDTPLNVVDYDEIINTNDLDSLFNQGDGIIIFYPNSEDAEGVFGHFVSLVRNPKKKTYYFNDSYGGLPDVGQKPENKEDFYKERLNSLILHFLNSDYNVDYNEKTLQSENENINSCGRHSLMRCMYSNLTNDQYYKKIRGLCKKYNVNPDQLVSIAWS